MISAHENCHLLNHCFAVQKIMHIATPFFPLFPTDSSVCRYDDALHLTLEINLNLCVKSWDQASLPVSFGGLRVCRASAVALPNFLLSASASGKLGEPGSSDRSLPVAETE